MARAALAIGAVTQSLRCCRELVPCESMQPRCHVLMRGVWLIARTSVQKTHKTQSISLLLRQIKALKKQTHVFGVESRLDHLDRREFIPKRNDHREQYTCCLDLLLCC